MPPENHSGGGGLFFLFGCTLWPRLLWRDIVLYPTTQHTRWDSSTHTVTQAFRHSLPHTNTISVTFHYMVQGWISGLETHQISSQEVPPPHAWHCLSATMLNCFLFALRLMAKIKKNIDLKWIEWILSCVYWCITYYQEDITEVTGIASSYESLWYLWGLLQCRQLFNDPPHPTLSEPVVSHKNSTCRVVKNLN